MSPLFVDFAGFPCRVFAGVGIYRVIAAAGCSAFIRWRVTFIGWRVAFVRRGIVFIRHNRGGFRRYSNLYVRLYAGFAVAYDNAQGV